MGETIFLLCFCAAAIAMYGMTGNFRISKMDTSGGAAMFPRIVIILLLVFLAIRLLQIWIGKQKKPFMGRELFIKSFHCSFFIKKRLYSLSHFILFNFYSIDCYQWYY